MTLSYDMILENFVRTENKQTDRQRTENSKPEATLIPVDSRGEGANYVDKQTNNMYINKLTTVKARFNPNSIKNFLIKNFN